MRYLRRQIAEVPLTYRTALRRFRICLREVRDVRYFKRGYTLTGPFEDVFFLSIEIRYRNYRMYRI